MRKNRFVHTLLVVLLVLASITTVIVGAAPVKPTITITIHMIQDIDTIEDYGAETPSWYYHLNVWNNGDWIEYERPTTVKNGILDEGNIHTFHLTNQASKIVKFYISLYEVDGYITVDEIADISGHDGVLGTSLRGPAPRGAQFFGVYDIAADTFTNESDMIVFDNQYYYTSGDFDGSTETDENDATVWFKINDNYEEPVAEAGEDQIDTLGSQLFFDGTASTTSWGSSIIKYEWDWEDDGTYDTQGATRSYVFPSKGIHTVKLRVTDSIGNVATDTMKVEIINLKPDAVFNLSLTEATIFDNITYLDDSSDPDGEIEYWWWDFGDGEISQIQNPIHSYSERGVYNVTLTVWDDTGAIDTAHQLIDIVNVGPTADFQVIPQMTKIEKTVNFTDKSVDPEGFDLEYLWLFGDGTTSSEKNPHHKYALSGNMTVTLTVTDDTEEESSITKYIIIVPNVPPDADFTYNPEAQLNNHEVEFYDASEDEDGYIIDWNWDFDDGTTSNLRDPIHIFSVGGNYTVELTVTDENGDINTIIKKVTIVQTYDLTIQVKDLFGSSITDAEVKVYGENDWYKAGTTNEYGGFSLRELLVGQYTIETKVLGLTTSSEVELTEHTTEIMTVNVSMSTIGVALGVIAFAAIGIYFLTKRSKTVPVEE